MQVREIYSTLDTISPFCMQEEWDNSGLQIGSMSAPVSEIVVSLEASGELLDELAPNSLLITHHPLIFKGLKKLDFDLFPQNSIEKAIKKDISIISLHTNFDKSHLNRYVAMEVLGATEIRQDGLLIEFDVNLLFDELLEQVSKKLKLQILNYVKSSEFVKTASIVVGSGGSFVPIIKSDLYLSGDIKYHEAIYAKEVGLSLIDITHHGSERYFTSCMERCLQNLGYCCRIHDFKNPFNIFFGRSDEQTLIAANRD